MCFMSVYVLSPRSAVFHKGADGSKPTQSQTYNRTHTQTHTHTYARTHTHMHSSLAAQLYENTGRSASVYGCRQTGLLTTTWNEMYSGVGGVGRLLPSPHSCRETRVTSFTPVTLPLSLSLSLSHTHTHTFTLTPLMSIGLTFLSGGRGCVRVVCLCECVGHPTTHTQIHIHTHIHTHWIILYLSFFGHNANVLDMKPFFFFTTLRLI